MNSFFLKDIVYGRHNVTNECRFTRIIYGYFNQSITFKQKFLEFLEINPKGKIEKFSIKPEKDGNDLIIFKDVVIEAIVENKLTANLNLEQIKRYYNKLQNRKDVSHKVKIICVIQYNSKIDSKIKIHGKYIQGFKNKVVLKNWSDFIFYLRNIKESNKLDHFLINNFLSFMNFLSINYIGEINSTKLEEINKYVSNLLPTQNIRGSFNSNNNVFKILYEVSLVIQEIVRDLKANDALDKKLSININSNIRYKIRLKKSKKDEFNVPSILIYFYANLKGKNNVKKDKYVEFGYIFYSDCSYIFAGIGSTKGGLNFEDEESNSRTVLNSKKDLKWVENHWQTFLGNKY